MWYFAWILGVLLACACGIINLLWLETHESLAEDSTSRDPLTKLLNKIEFKSALANQIDKYKQQSLAFSIIFLELDDFKTFIDLDDHSEEIKVLMDVANILKLDLREHVDIAARYGKDEFAVILPGAPFGVAKRIAERIRQSINETIKLDGEYPVGASIGVAEYPKHIDLADQSHELGETETMVKVTRDRMQRARNSGGNQINFGEQTAPISDNS